MSKEANALQIARQGLDISYQYGENCLCKDMDNGLHIEITVACWNSATPLFNVCLTHENKEVGRSTDVSAENLSNEIDTLCFLVCLS